MRFGLVLSLNDFLNVFDFFALKVWKHFLDFLSFLSVFFLKILEISLISLRDFTGIEGGSNEIDASLLPFALLLVLWLPSLIYFGSKLSFDLMSK